MKNRVHKYRMWQPHSSLDRKPGMYEVEMLAFYYDQEGHGEAFPKGYKNSEYLDDVHLMQFTGLKDKNGVEIYEGDIVRRRIANYYSESFEDEVEEVKFKEGSFVAFDDTSLSIFVVFNTEVIGNIYENKELLERQD